MRRSASEGASGKVCACAGFAFTTEKILQEIHAPRSEHAGRDFHLMVQAGMIYYRDNTVDSAGFGVGRSIHQAPDARVNQGARTHGARLDGHEHRAVEQAMVPDGPSGFAQGQDLRMSSWIVIRDIAVSGARDQLVLKKDHGSDRYFAERLGPARLAQSFFHPEFVGTSRHAQAE